MQNVTSVYIADCDPLTDSALFDAYYRQIPPQRQAKIDRVRLEKDKRLSLGAGVLAGLFLPHEVQRCIVADEYGKPYLPDRSLYFNLSHAGSIAMLAVSPQSVGCDTEQIQPGRMRVAKRYFNESEYHLLMSQPDEAARDVMFCRLWTLKESFMKATGLGMRLPLDSFCISFENEKATVTHQVNPHRYTFCEYDPALPYRFAVCVQGETAFAPCCTVNLADEAVLQRLICP